MNILRDLILYPGIVFKNPEIRKKRIILFFVVTFSTVFIKSFFKAQNYVHFFDNTHLDGLLRILSIPQVQVVVQYIFFYVFIVIVFGILALAKCKHSFPSLTLSLMSVCIIGFVAHIISFFLFFINKTAIGHIGFIFYVWCIILSIVAIKKSQNISYFAAILCFLLSSTPFLLIYWPAPLFPYLVLLNF